MKDVKSFEGCEGWVKGKNTPSPLEAPVFIGFSGRNVKGEGQNEKGDKTQRLSRWNKNCLSMAKVCPLLEHFFAIERQILICREIEVIFPINKRGLATASPYTRERYKMHVFTTCQEE